MVDLWCGLKKPVSNLMLVWIILMGVYVSVSTYGAALKSPLVNSLWDITIDKFFINKIKIKTYSGDICLCKLVSNCTGHHLMRLMEETK